MNGMNIIIEETLKKLRKNETFKNWTTKHFDRLGDILAMPAKTEEDIERNVKALTDLLLEVE